LPNIWIVESYCPDIYLKASRGMANDHAVPGPLMWSQQGQNASPPVQKTPASRRQKPTSDLSEAGATHTDQRSKVVVKQLSLRVNDQTHSRITLAAQKADKSINAWMEEVLSEAAEDVLALGGDDAIHSSAIRKLLDDPDYASRLIENIAKYLRDTSVTTIFQLGPALRKLLVGWDRIKPFLKEDAVLPLDLVQDLAEPQGMAKLINAISPFLQDGSPVSMLQLNRALKKLFLGIAAIKPFVKGENSHILYVVITIERLLSEIEQGSSSG
jgi:uncharacterized protein (DUF1778 family)